MKLDKSNNLIYLDFSIRKVGIPEVSWCLVLDLLMSWEMNLMIFPSEQCYFRISLKITPLYLYYCHDFPMC